MILLGTKKNSIPIDAMTAPIVMIKTLINKTAFKYLMFSLYFNLEKFNYNKYTDLLFEIMQKQKGSEEPSKSFLVAGAGLEPATLWL